MEEIKEKLREKFIEKLSELGGEKDITEMTYDEIYNEIMLNSEDVDYLMTIAEAIRFNPILTEWQKEKLWDLIDKIATKRG